MVYRTLTTLGAVLAASALGGLAACAQESPASEQIAGAVSPLPEAMREGAAVLGYRRGRLVSLREGTNGMICLADDPAREGFHAACYHKDLEPFMARGRALTTEGKERPAIDSIRQAEIEAGSLAMPLEPRALTSRSIPPPAWCPSPAVFASSTCPTRPRSRPASRRRRGPGRG
jgi:hypothetical protein